MIKLIYCDVLRWRDNPETFKMVMRALVHMLLLDRLTVQDDGDLQMFLVSIVVFDRATGTTVKI